MATTTTTKKKKQEPEEAEKKERIYRDPLKSDRGIRSLKPEETNYGVPDSKVTGLALRVLTSGTKTWSFRYRVGRRWRRLSLGPYPAVGLAAARDLAREKRLELAQGDDPATKKRKKREARTFEDLAELYLDRYALGPGVGPRQSADDATDDVPAGSLLAEDGSRADVWNYSVREGRPRKRSWIDDRSKLRRYAVPAWGGRLASEVERGDVVDLLEDVAYSGGPIQSNRVRALLSKLFNFAIDRGVVSANPVHRTPKMGEEVRRDRVLTEEEIRALWNATDDMSPAMSATWRLRLVTAQRAREVVDLRWSEIDLDKAQWLIPSERRKNRREHVVPLSDLAVEILGTVERLDEYVFVGARGNHQQGAALAALREATGADDWTGHDLRRTAASLMAAGGVPRHHIGRVLGHSEHGVTAIYDRHDYLSEKRVALDTLARALRSIVEGEGEGAKVVPISRA